MQLIVNIPPHISSDLTQLRDDVAKHFVTMYNLFSTTCNIWSGKLTPDGTKAVTRWYQSKNHQAVGLAKIDVLVTDSLYLLVYVDAKLQSEYKFSGDDIVMKK